jgi:hypothetical protein
MKITYILKDFTPAFYEGFPPSIVGFNTLSDSDKFKQLERMRRERRVTGKVGNADSFRDKVELNLALKGPHSIQFKLEPRRGYKLATFEINPA